MGREPSGGTLLGVGAPLPAESLSPGPCSPLTPPPKWLLGGGIPKQEWDGPGHTLLSALLRSASCSQGGPGVSSRALAVSLTILDCPSAEPWAQRGF